MTQIYANNFITLALGRRGENLARKVVFDIRDLESLYGTGDVEVIYQRPCDAQPYPLTVQREGTLVTWDVTSTDTEMSGGSGKCELRYYVGETLAKSKTWRTWVEPAMGTPSETAPPEPEQGWVDQIIAVGAAAKASADAAKADADRASELAAQASEKAAQTAQDASDADKAMEAAQTAQRLAEEAQGAAEAARTAAAAAQAAAETAATDAAGAKQDAETALKSAQDAAAAAAKALADIRALYQEMQTWAQGVIQGVNDAGSVAVQSVQSAGDAQVQRVTNEGETQTANAKAQADAAAQSAAGAAQSAQEAAESAAVYDGVVADVTQLKQDIAAEQTTREQADTSLQQEISTKLPKSPVDWEPWTAEEQAAARARMAVENGADFELLVDAKLEEEANTFTVVFPKPVRECIYHIWFYNNNGANVTAQTRCLDNSTTSNYLLKHTSNIRDGYGYALNGYFRYNGPIKSGSVIGYAADSQATLWTTDIPGNGNSAYTNYPTPTILRKVDGLKFQLMDAGHVLNVGATIKVWGR